MSLQLRGIAASYGARTALTDISLSLDGPRLTGIIGPNGAGKSTLLKTIAGLTTSSGEITLDGIRIDKLSTAERARKVAYCAQSLFPAWSITVDEVVRLGRIPHRGDPDASAHDAKAVALAIDALDLSDLATRPVDSLSGGERSRALLARAVCTQARVLLADEPTAGLDPYFELGTMQFLRAEAQRDVHILAVLHNLSLAARFCDSLIVLQQGQIFAAGPPAEILTQSLLADVYGIDALIEQRDDSVLVQPWNRLE